REDYSLLDRIAKSCEDELRKRHYERRQQQAALRANTISAAQAIVTMWARLRGEKNLCGTWDTLDAVITSEVGADRNAAKRLVDAVMDVFEDDGGWRWDAAEEVASRIIGNFKLRYFDKAA